MADELSAYEMANELEKGPLVPRDDAAKMIRQQADRIAELEKQSKPVAWMEYIQGEEWEVWYVEPTDLPEGHTYKPLYLAPQTKLCNGFCGEQECKDNQKNCERARMAKKLLGLGTPQTKPLHEFKGYEVVEQNDFDVTVRMPIDDWQHLMSDAPQTKPLSDEEIKEVIRKHWNRKYGNRDMLTLCKAVLEEANK